MPGPVIGVAWPRPDYIAAIERAGGTVRELVPDTDLLPHALAQCDGLLLTGGEDVDPAHYGEAPHPTVEFAHERDRYELALARQAIDHDVPLLAICRGVQVLNVAAGGTLVQDIPSQHPTDVPHTLTQPKDAMAHEVVVEPRSCLARLLASSLGPDGRMAVNSRHHQSVKATAPDFVVSATAPDGVIEAIEKPHASFCVGVQWHPENFWQTGEFADLFQGFVKAAAEHRPKHEP